MKKIKPNIADKYLRTLLKGSRSMNSKGGTSNMDVNGLGSVLNSYQQAATKSVASKVSEDTVSTEAAAVEKEEPAAVYEPSTKVETGDYSSKISAMLAESQKRIAEFQNMFARYLGGQASNYDIANWSKAAMEKAFTNATPEDVATAQAAIEEGGYYSVGAVSDRIMDMAMGLSGGDPEKIDMLREAVQKGFEQAGAVYGDTLPQICQDTYSEIMNRFDEWEASASSEGKETTEIAE